MVATPFDPHIVCCILCLMMEIVEEPSQSGRDLSSLLEVVLQKWPQWKKRTDIDQLATARNASFENLLPSVVFSLTHFIKKLLITYFFFVGQLSSWLVWTRDEPFSLMCWAIIACCKSLKANSSAQQHCKTGIMLLTRGLMATYSCWCVFGALTCAWLILLNSFFF